MGLIFLGQQLEAEQELLFLEGPIPSACSPQSPLLPIAFLTRRPSPNCDLLSSLGISLLLK